MRMEHVLARFNRLAVQRVLSCADCCQKLDMFTPHLQQAALVVLIVKANTASAWPSKLDDRRTAKYQLVPSDVLQKGKGERFNPTA